MLFLLFQLGQDRYALEASRVVEVLPLLPLKRLPQAPPGIAGLFNYRGRPVPAVDLCELLLGHPAADRLSTRIIAVQYPTPGEVPHPVLPGSSAVPLLGLIAEHATELVRKEAAEFVHPGLKIPGAPYLGPVLMDPLGPVQWIYEQRLLSEPVRQLLASLPQA